MTSEDYGVELEQKFLKIGTDLTVVDGNRIEGYASVFGSCDQGGDIVQAGAYTSSLERMTQEGRRVKMLWQHDPTQPIGVWEEVYEDKTGLYVRGRILPDVARGKEAAALIAAGAIDGLSIGYRTIRASKDTEGRRLLQELDLWEVSLVTFPMLPDARVGAKGDRMPEDTLMQDLTALFRDACAEAPGN